MQWEELTAPAFARAVDETRTCVLALGVLERHGDHLPLGTDYINAHRIACLAAEREPAVVFPPFYMGQIYEARCFPGAFTLRPTLLLDLLQGVLDEIGRNGFRKIILYNGHGGNTNLVRFLTQCALWEQKPYTVYTMQERLTPEQRKAFEAIRETTEGGHACEVETSVTLANRPDLVRMEDVPHAAGVARQRLDHLPAAYTAVSWYANYPEHYAGDARTASEEKGRTFRDIMVDNLAAFIRAVKEDTIAPALQEEFFRRARDVGSLG